MLNNTLSFEAPSFESILYRLELGLLKLSRNDTAAAAAMNASGSNTATGRASTSSAGGASTDGGAPSTSGASSSSSQAMDTLLTRHHFQVGVVV